MLVELKIVKMNGNVQIFKVELPQIKPSLDIPKTLKLEYGVESEECESNINYERVPASKMECVTRPHLGGRIKEVKNTATCMTESDILSMYSDLKSEDNQKKDDDDISILDPDDGMESPAIEPSSEYIPIEGTRFSYHPRIKDRLYELRTDKNEKLVPIRVSRVPRQIKQKYYDIVKRDPPVYKTKSSKRNPDHRSKSASPKRRRLIFELFEKCQKNECELVCKELEKYQKVIQDESLDINKHEILELIDYIKFNLTFTADYRTPQGELATICRIRTKEFAMETKTTNWKRGHSGGGVTKI